MGPIGGMAVGAVLAVVTQWTAWTTRPLSAVAIGSTVVAFIGAGAHLLREPGQRGNGRLFVLAGVAYAGMGLSLWGSGPFPLIGVLCRPVSFTAMATVLVRYPADRLASSRQRLLAGALLVWTELLYVSAALAPDAGPLGYSARGWWPDPVLDAEMARLVQQIGFSGICVVAVAGVFVIRRNLASTSGIDRSEAVPVAVAAVAAALFLFGSRLLYLLVDGERAAVLVPPLQSLVLLVVPVALTVAVVRRRLAAVAVADVVEGVVAGSSVAEVRDHLRRALCDPRLELLVRAGDGFVAADGGRVDLPEEHPGRWAIPVRGCGGTELAVVLADPSLRRHPRLVDAATSATALALDNAVLRASVQEQLASVHASRARILEAGLMERRRLERELHDGAHQRLLGLTEQLGALRTRVADDPARQLLDSARTDLLRAMSELRDLARGLHPAVLTEAGLGPALATVAGRLPLPVSVDVPSRRWSAVVEAAAYFLVCEALTNTAKHAAATEARVRVVDQRDRLCVEIEDDGVGGAEFQDGGGLAGLRDRVAALGGRLTVESRPGSGTCVRADLPCGQRAPAGPGRRSSPGPAAGGRPASPR